MVNTNVLVKLCSVEKSIITDPLIQVIKTLVKHRFSLHNNTVDVMYSRNIPMAEKLIVCLKICRF